MAGRVFSLAVGPLSATWSISDDGTLAPAASGAAPDLKLTLSPLSVPSFLADPARWNEFVREEGDAELGGVLKELARTMPWFVEETFAKRARPDRWASAPPTPAGGCSRFPEYAAQRLAESAGSYARDEAGLLARGVDARRLRERDRRRSRRASTRSRNASTRSDRPTCARRFADRFKTCRWPSVARPPPPAPTLAKFSRPRLYNVQKRSACSAARRASLASDPLDRGAARRGQVDAGRKLRRSAQAAGHVVPGRPRRRRSRDVLPLPARRPPPTSPARRTRDAARAARVRRRVRERPAGVHAPLPARVLRAVSAGLGARRRQLPRAQGRRAAGASRSPKACARFRRA